MLRIYIARHGQDEDNAHGILNGHRNNPLTAIGLEQARGLAVHIRTVGLSFDKVYCSPLQRASVTAETVTDALGMPKPEKLDLLIERDFGTMTGKLARDIESLCAPAVIRTEAVTYFLDPEGAETFPQLLERVQQLFAFLNERHHDGSILLVCHGDIGKMLYAKYYNLDWQDVLRQFRFGNSEVLLLAPDSPPEEVFVFQTKQHNG